MRVENQREFEEDAAAVVSAFYDWLASGRHSPGVGDGPAFRAYWRGIAEARYVIRKITRIVDEQARRAGLEPLEYQALIQILGAPSPRRISDLAERLDIPPALASRLVGRLESDGLVKRTPSTTDKRSIYVIATENAYGPVSQIDDAVGRHMSYFHEQTSQVERAVAFGILASYAGASTREDLDALIRVAHDRPGAARANSS
jgi:DNA-binding MarR family transcriptional regulator